MRLDDVAIPTGQCGSGTLDQIAQDRHAEAEIGRPQHRNVRDADWIASRWPAESPVVPDTSALPRATHRASTGSKASAG